MTAIADNLRLVREEIAQACSEASRSASEITLVAVSKTKPLKLLQEAFAAGQRSFGENYAQELEQKFHKLAEGAPSDLCEYDFHLIGALQSNKAQRVVGKVSLIHAVDRVKIAEAINKAANKMGVVQSVLIQVNISGENSKSGVKIEELSHLMERVVALPALDVQGLMCIGSSLDGAEAKVVEREFAAMCELRQKLSADFSLPLKHISMGMSDDFGLAIKHGATIVRVGSRIFGAR